MWIEQYKYPFTNFVNHKIILSYENIKFIQIGIECPHSIPIFLYDSLLDIRVKISDNSNHNITSEHSYKINSPDVLEFNNLSKKDLTIEISYPEDPYTIITIAYEKED